MKCKKLACKCHLIFKTTTTPRPAHKLRRNICCKPHISKKYAIKIDQKLHAALGTIPNMQCGSWKPASLTPPALQHFPHTWWSWQAVLNFSHIFIKLKNFNLTAISWHLRKQVGVITCPIY